MHTINLDTDFVISTLNSITSPKDRLSQFGSAGACLLAFFEGKYPEPILIQLDPSRIEAARKAAELIMQHFCCVLKVFESDNIWFPLTVSLSAHEERTHGTGENPLHIDYVDRSAPPEFIGLFGARRDPLNGGATILAPMRVATTHLNVVQRSLLALPIFRYWTDSEATNVGDPLECFAVIPDNNESSNDWTRFTSKMLKHLHKDSPVIISHPPVAEEELLAALLEFYQAMLRLRLVHQITEGQFIIFSQKAYAHGRLAMGYGQELIDSEERRLLYQIYANRK